MKLGGSSYFRRSVMLAAACILAVVLTACTGKGGGYLPPQSPVFTGQASFGFTFSCAKGDLRVDPVVESVICIGEIPPTPPNEITFLGRYTLTSSAPSGFPAACPKKETSSSPLCRFEVTVRDNDQSLSPTPGDSFSIMLSTATCPDPTDVSCSTLPVGSVFYTRAGTLAGGNITVK